MTESIKAELEQLESVGRLTARDHRPVHSEFGFATIEKAPQTTATAAPVADHVVASLDDAWSRLKQRINPE